MFNSSHFLPIISLESARLEANSFPRDNFIRQKHLTTVDQEME